MCKMITMFKDIQLEEPKNINQINKIIMSNDDIWRII